MDINLAKTMSKFQLPWITDFWLPLRGAGMKYSEEQKETPFRTAAGSCAAGRIAKERKRRILGVKPAWLTKIFLICSRLQV
jgi:hypothetical protein